MNLKYQRTFHPVGQGAFYTETHFVNNKEFNVVYDCGSNSLPKNELRDYIYSVIKDGTVIDVLFLSHLHSDHVNGIKYLMKRCLIKNVVLPLIPHENKPFLKIENRLDGSSDFDALIDNPRDFFDDSTNIYLIEESGDEATEVATIVLNNESLETYSQSQYVKSGTRFIFSSIDWFYIPYNYKQNERVKPYKNELNKNGIQLDKLNDIDYITDPENFKILRDALRIVKTTGDGLNENSMILFSGTIQDIWVYTERGYTEYKEYPLHYYNDGQAYPSCIYFGDADLNKNGLIHSLYNYLGRTFSKSVGTIQIPHHGSHHNFNHQVLLTFEPQFGIISCGRNAYGHPSRDVLLDCKNLDVPSLCVREYPYSIVYQEHM